MKKRKSLLGMIALALVGAGWSLLIIQSKKVEGYTMKSQAGNSAMGQKKSEQKSTFACNMLALNTEERKRHIEVTKRPLCANIP